MSFSTTTKYSKILSRNSHGQNGIYTGQNCSQKIYSKDQKFMRNLSLCIAWHCLVLLGIAWYCLVLLCIVWNGMALFGIVWNCIKPYTTQVNLTNLPAWNIVEHSECNSICRIIISWTSFGDSTQIAQLKYMIHPFTALFRY